MRKNQLLPTTGLSFFRFNLQSAAAQPSKFFNHGWTRINPDQDGEPASHKVRLHNESIASSHRFVIRVHPCPSVVQLLFLG